MRRGLGARLVVDAAKISFEALACVAIGGECNSFLPSWPIVRARIAMYRNSSRETLHLAGQYSTAADFTSMPGRGKRITTTETNQPTTV